MIVGVYEHMGDLMPFFLFLTFKALAVCLFFRASIECGWWWSVVTSFYDKFPDLVGGKIPRIKWCVRVYFFVFLFFASAIFLNPGWIFYILNFKTTAIIILVVLIEISLVCMFILRHFLFKTLKEVSGKYYNDSIEVITLSLFIPIRWSIQKNLNRIFNNT
jgi:hypothetical protein